MWYLVTIIYNTSKINLNKKTIFFEPQAQLKCLQKEESETLTHLFFIS